MNKRIGYLALVTLLLGAYQNCGMTSSHTTLSLLSGKTCDGVLAEAYQKTYYPLFRANCTSCHDAGGEAGSGRWFSQADLDKSFASFKSLGRSKVENMALNPGHKPPKTGSQHSAAISAAQPVWAQAEFAAQECASEAEIATVKKALPATVYSVATPPNDGAAWPRLTFDLMTEVQNAGLKGKIRLTVSLEVRRSRQPGTTTDVGYDFRNPRVLVSGAAPLPAYRIRGLKIVRNDQIASQVTFWDTLDFTASSGTETLMRAGGYTTLVTGALGASDQFALRFVTIEDSSGNPISPSPGPAPAPTPLPTRVSYADLVSANQQLGVFNRRCLSCHSGGGSAAGFDMSTYAGSTANGGAALIQSRINSANNPMPPSGLMSIDERAIIDIWVNGGAPQN